MRPMFKEMVRLTDEFQQRSILGDSTAPWRDHVLSSRENVSKFAFGTGLIVELSEFITEAGYKWWQTNEYNREKVCSERTDCFQCAISFLLLLGEGKDHEELASDIFDAWNGVWRCSSEPRSRMTAVTEDFTRAVAAASKAQTCLIESLGIVHDDYDGYIYSDFLSTFFYLFDMCKEVELSSQDLAFRFYGKSALIKVRRDAIQKYGSYDKKWFVSTEVAGFEGVEDNKILSYVLEHAKGFSYDELLSVLSRIYLDQHCSVWTVEYEDDIKAIVSQHIRGRKQ